MVRREPTDVENTKKKLTTGVLIVGLGIQNRLLRLESLDLSQVSLDIVGVGRVHGREVRHLV